MQGTRCSPAARAAFALATSLAVSSITSPARADDSLQVEAHEEWDREAQQPYHVFVYLRPQPKNYLRVTLEELGILAAGMVEYIQTQDLQQGDWDLSFSADSFESKVKGNAVSFDSNKFGTNWVTHPLAGWLYYGAARSNRLGPLESLAIATAASTTWEFLGEYREQAAINDMMVTPIGGAALFEPMQQLGAWFERGRPTPARTFMAWLLAPGKRIHDAVDDADPLRAPAIERGELEARVLTAYGSTWESSTEAVRSDLTVGARTHLFFGPSVAKPGFARMWLDDANLSTIRLEATFADEELIDTRIATRVAFAGFYSKNVVDTDSGPVGHGLFLGLGTGIDYHLHQYAHQRGSIQDEIALIELLGTTLENSHRIGPVRLRTDMLLNVDFAGVRSLALPERQRRRGNAGLPTVLVENDYAHALGATIAPSLRVSLPPLTAFGEARIDAFRTVIARDRYYERYEPTVSGSDERLTASTGLSYGLLQNCDVAVRLSRLFRRSRIEDVTQTYGETTLRFEAALRL